MSKRKMKDVEEMSGNYEIKPVGWYKVLVTDKLELRYGRDTGNPYVAVRFFIMDGQYKKSYLFRNIALTVKAIGFLKPFLAAIGWDDDDEIEIEDKSQTIKIDEREWIDKKLQVYVSHKPKQDDDDDKQEEVTAYKRLDDADDYELTPDELPPMSEPESKSDNEEDEEVAF